MYWDLPVIMIDALYCRSTAVLLAMHVWLYVVAVLYMVSDAGRPRGDARARPRTVHPQQSISLRIDFHSFTGRAWLGARTQPVSGVTRCQPGARRPTGRRRRPEASAPSSARPRGVFSEMPPRNHALGDGGAGQVHGQALVRLEPLASGRDATGPRGAHGKSPAQP